MSDLIVPNIICFQKQKQLVTLNNIQVLLKSVSIDLAAYNVMHMKTSLTLCARCIHACDHVHSLLSPEINLRN